MLQATKLGQLRSIVRLSCVALGVGLIAGQALPASASPVQLDISSVLNYDVVGTSLEMSAKETDYISGTLGDHSIFNNRHYTNQATAGGGTALPDDGAVGPYQMVNAYDNGTDGLTKSNNALALRTANDGPTVVSQTITLPTAQQGQYNSFNMLFVTDRSVDHANYRSWIEATYTDGSTVIVVDTGLSSTGVNGTFGGRLQNAVYEDTFLNQAPGDFGTEIGVQSVLVMDRMLGQSGSSQGLRTETAVMWEFDTAILLDPTKTLESLTINIRKSGASRNQSLWVFGVNAEPIPEPASLALLGGGALMLLRRRAARA